MAHKFKASDYAAKKAAAADAKAKQAAVPQNVPELRALVSQLMAALGMR